MEKKYFTVPYLKVVEVKNDILTSSISYGGTTSDPSFGGPSAPERHGMWDEEFCEDDLY